MKGRAGSAQDVGWHLPKSEHPPFHSLSSEDFHTRQQLMKRDNRGTQSVTETRKMKSISLLLLCVLLAFAPVSQAGQAEDYCCLCDGCGPPLKDRRNIPANRNGDTCNDIALKMVDPRNNIRPNSSSCRSHVSNYRNQCCASWYRPEKYDTPKPTNPADKYGSGPYRKCDLCHSGKFPSKPYTLTAVLNLDWDEKKNPTCTDLYWLGKVGRVSEQLCNPMQDYMDVPCGCYDRNPDPNKGGGATAGGAPNQGGGEGTDPGNGIPPKKGYDSDSSKGDDTKLYQGGGGNCRGCLRHLRTKGSTKR